MQRTNCKYLLAPGIIDIDKMREDGLYPTDERLRQGPVAVFECGEEIPCNPCETACKKGFVSVGIDITQIPIVDEECSGCGLCLPKCPGLSIFILDGSLSGDMASVTIPYELFPLPEEGEVVEVLDRYGGNIGDGEIMKCRKLYRDDTCWSITLRVPFALIHKARHFRRKE